MSRACWSSQTSSERSESRSSRFTLQFRWRDPRRRSRSGTHDRRSGLTLTGWCDGRTALTTSTARRLSATAVISLDSASTQQRCQVGGVVLEGAAQRKTPSSQVWVCGRQFQTSAACLAFGSLERVRAPARDAAGRGAVSHPAAEEPVSFTTPNLYQRLQPHDPHG